MTPLDLPKQYDPKVSQSRWYELWVRRGYFHAPSSGNSRSFSIVIPPPNVTGALHLGHALNNTIQDILIRWKRMQGYDTLWMPGTDHAGIATQAVVEKRLLQEEKKTRHEIGRDALVKRIWAWKDEYEARILGQLRLMGCSCDWDRTRFTLDPVCARAVRETFFRLFRAGKLFRGKRLVNWDTHLRTAVADDEIEYKEIDGHLWTIRYPVPSRPGFFLRVATTRPETMLGDTAVAVHPGDERFQELIGSEAELPLIGRRIPIIGDAILVDPTFGTGCVKVTPAHDPNDYQTGLRHNLPMINLLNPDGTYNLEAGPYAGLDRRDVRKRVVADLESHGLLEKVEPYKTRVGFSDRSKTAIEPYLSDQWFVRMADDPDGNPGFATLAMEAVTSGKVRIHPERYAKSYLDWLAEKRDWCVSRQLWWGHRIPVWRLDHPADYLSQINTLKRESENNPELRDQIFFAIDQEAAYACLHNPELHQGLVATLEQLGFVQDPDVLDTWFSSALWPHSTLGWPEPTPELAKYYPTSVLSTARDIITLWVARMVIFGQFNMGDVPFRDVYIHPVIQDGEGRRMSKSAGNGIDPVDIIELYGADALRYTLASAATETQDLRMPVEQAVLPDGRVVNTSKRFEEGRTFPNKFWNASRFALLNLEGYTPGNVLPETLDAEDRWILSLLARASLDTTNHLEHYRFADLAKTLRDFTWSSFCDWYVEFIKGRIRDPEKRPTAQRVLATVLDGLCRLLHPIMPFVTESVWQALGSVAPIRGLPQPTQAAESVCIAPWPTFPDSWFDPEAEADVSIWQSVITSLRNTRAEKNLPRDAKLSPILVAPLPLGDRLRRGLPFIESLAGARSISVVEQSENRENASVTVLGELELIVPLVGLVDPEIEKSKHRKALADVEKQLEAIRKKLSNEGFISRAPADVIQQQRAREAELLSQRESIQLLLNET